MDILTFPNFLTKDECDEYIWFIKEKEAVCFTDSGLFTNKKWYDLSLSTFFYERLKSFCADNCERYLRPNDVVMAGMYKPGDSFSMHTDTGLFYDRKKREKSRWTMLIYLNDGYEGGETIFYDSDTWEEKVRIKPEEGKCLLFDIDLWHKGDVLLSGEKYWIGCEIIGVF